jgi:hypothetical protein
MQHVFIVNETCVKITPGNDCKVVGSKSVSNVHQFVVLGSTTVRLVVGVPCLSNPLKMLYSCSAGIVVA